MNNIEGSSSSSSSTVTFVDYNGGKIALHDEYQYHRIRSYKNGSSILRCSTYKKTKCRGTITEKDNIIIKKQPHTCAPDPFKNMIIHEKLALKEVVKNSDQPIPKLYEETIDKLKDKGLHLVTNLPDFQNLKHSLYDARKKSAGINKTTYKIAEEVEVPEQFHDFLMADYFYNGNRILVFCSPESRLLLPQVKEYFVDGTFKSCPKPFKQMFTIHGDFGSTHETVNIKPLVFILMCNKKQLSYVRALGMIKSQIPEWDISKVHCDFELAIINAITIVFPRATIKGCYYHWCRNVWKKAKLEQYKIKAEKRIIGLTAALPLLPSGNINEGWEYIKQEILNKGLKMVKFTRYIEKRFKIKNFLSVLEVFGERHRTNNYLEGWHGKINKSINKNTVNLLRLLNRLKVVVANAEVQLKKYNKRGHRRSKKQIMNDDVIRTIQMEYLNNEISLGHALDQLR